MRFFILMAVLLTLLACSTNLANLPEELNLTPDEIIPLELPEWFLTTPQDSYLALGIAPTTIYDSLKTDNSLREYASILASRQSSSIVIVKLKMRTTDRVKTPTLVDFRLQVARDLDELNNYYEESQVYCTTELNGMTIGLVGRKGLNLDLNCCQVPINEVPSWYTEDTYTTETNLLVSSAKASAVNMSLAYQSAYEEAVYKLIRSIKADVRSALISSEFYYEHFIEIDASLIIENLKNTKNSLILRKCDNSFIYDAYVEVTWQPQYKFEDIKIKG